MMSVSARSAASASNYYSHAAQDDYYNAGGEGQWQGEGAEKLGLAGPVAPAAFQSLCRGVDPQNPESKLVQNAGDPTRIAGYDCTLSAPKSVSVAWAIGDEKTRADMQSAHVAAVGKTLELLQEKCGYTRTGKDGQEREAVGLTIARFDHATSREQDPQLHSHCFIMNIATREDGKTSAIDGHGFFDWKMAAGAIYQVELSEQLRVKGYATERDGDSFRMTTISREVDREFSQRRQQIEEQLKARGQCGAKASEVAALDTRKPKSERDPAEMKKEWTERAAAHGMTAENIKIEQQSERVQMVDAQQMIAAATENRSVVKEQDLYLAAARANIAIRGADDALRDAQSVKDAAVHLENSKGEIRYTAVDLHQIEKANVDIAKARQGEGEAHGLKSETLAKVLDDPKCKLSDEQKNAVRHLSNASGMAVMVGDAGTGKSTTLEAARQAWEAEGVKVLGAAPTGKAAAGLQESAGIQSSTIHKLQHEIDKGNISLDSKTVLVVDEAGMVGSRRMHDLIQRCDQAGAKLVLVGDHKQLQSVEAGAAFRDIEKEIGSARLETIYRQREEWHKEAVTQLSKGQVAEAMASYCDKGQVHIAETHRQAVKEIAATHIKNMREVGATNTISLAATNTKVRDLNAEVRNQLKTSGQLSDGKQVATGKGQIEVAQGERVVFTKNENRLGTGIKNGDLATVKKIEGDSMTVTLDRTRQEIRLDLKEYSQFRHGYAITTHKSQGATVDRAVVWAGPDASREMAYVQGSRARESTNWIYTRETVRKIEAQAAPTEKMSALAKAIEDQRTARGEKASLPADFQKSFSSCRDYLNQHASRIDERKSQLAVRDQRLESLRESLKSMSQSRQNESTRDFQVKKMPEQARVPEIKIEKDNSGREK